MVRCDWGQCGKGLEKPQAWGRVCVVLIQTETVGRRRARLISKQTMRLLPWAVASMSCSYEEARSSTELRPNICISPMQPLPSDTVLVIYSQVPSSTSSHSFQYLALHTEGTPKVTFQTRKAACVPPWTAARDFHWKAKKTQKTTTGPIGHAQHQILTHVLEGFWCLFFSRYPGSSLDRGFILNFSVHFLLQSPSAALMPMFV